MDNQRKIDEVKKHGLTKQGKNEIIRHLEGARLTMRQLVKAKCYDCMGYYADGGADCGIPTCPLYPYHPYNPNKQKNAAKGGFPRKRGIQTHADGEIGG